MNTEISVPFKDISFPTPRQMTLRQARRHKGFLMGGVVLLLIVIMALSAPLLAPHDPYHQDLAKRLTPPIWHDKGTWDHPLGTDNLGRDYLSRLMYGARISLIIGVAEYLRYFKLALIPTACKLPIMASAYGRLRYPCRSISKPLG